MALVAQRRHGCARPPSHLWEIALGIEDGDLALADKRLRDAQQKLSDALEKGASDEEIAKLMQELREAMQDYMEALARQAPRTRAWPPIPTRTTCCASRIWKR